MIKVRYFASLREEMGRDEDEIDASGVATIKDVWEQVSQRRELPSNLLMARNMDYSDMDCPVSDGDEVAFFPPVTGG